MINPLQEGEADLSVAFLDYVNIYSAVAWWDSTCILEISKQQTPQSVPNTVCTLFSIQVDQKRLHGRNSYKKAQ